jgi:hypothetical protein
MNHAAAITTKLEVQSTLGIHRYVVPQGECCQGKPACAQDAELIAVL